MQALTPYRPSSYPPKGPFIQWADSQLSHTMEEAQKALEKRLDTSIQAWEDKRLARHEYATTAQGPADMIPQRLPENQRSMLDRPLGPAPLTPPSTPPESEATGSPEGESRRC